MSRGQRRRRSRTYRASHGSCLLCDYAGLETRESVRVVAENDGFLAVVPWWAVWPFETLVIAKRHVRSLLDFGEAERDGLADILKQADDALRQSVRDELSVHDGLPPGADGWRGA